MIETEICQSCKAQFTIAPEDFVFYQKINVPPPTWCPECRYTERIKLKNPRRLWLRPCQCAGVFADHGGYKNVSAHFHGTSACPSNFETSFATDRPEVVYCEACYQEEII